MAVIHGRRSMYTKSYNMFCLIKFLSFGQATILQSNTEEEEYPPHDAPQDRMVDDFVGFFWQPNKLCAEYMTKFKVFNRGEVKKKNDQRYCCPQQIFQAHHESCRLCA